MLDIFGKTKTSSPCHIHQPFAYYSLFYFHVLTSVLRFFYNFPSFPFSSLNQPTPIFSLVLLNYPNFPLPVSTSPIITFPLPSYFSFLSLHLLTFLELSSSPPPLTPHRLFCNFCFYPLYICSFFTIVIFFPEHSASLSPTNSHIFFFQIVTIIFFNLKQVYLLFAHL